MSTVTAHSLLSQPVRYSAGGSSLRCPKPAVVSLPYYTPAGKKTRSVCHYADPRSIDHPSNMPTTVLVHPVATTTGMWKIKDGTQKVELTFFSIPEETPSGDFHVTVEGDVLEIKKPPTEHDDVSFHVRLLVPEVYDKKLISAKLDNRNLMVTIPKVQNLRDGTQEKPFFKDITVVKV